MLKTKQEEVAQRPPDKLVRPESWVAEKIKTKKKPNLSRTAEIKSHN